MSSAIIWNQIVETITTKYPAIEWRTQHYSNAEVIYTTVGGLKLSFSYNGWRILFELENTFETNNLDLIYTKEIDYSEDNLNELLINIDKVILNITQSEMLLLNDLIQLTKLTVLGK